MTTTLENLLMSLQSEYFIDREEILDVFEELIQTPARLKLHRMLVLFGPGGIVSMPVIKSPKMPD